MQGKDNGRWRRLRCRLLVFFRATHSGPARRMESLVAHVARKERDRSRDGGRHRRAARAGRALPRHRRADPRAREGQARRRAPRGPRRARRGSSACSSRTSAPPTKPPRAPPAYYPVTDREEEACAEALDRECGVVSGSARRRARAQAPATDAATTKLEANLRGNERKEPRHRTSGKAEIRLDAVDRQGLLGVKLTKIDGKPNAGPHPQGRQGRRRATCSFRSAPSSKRAGLHDRAEGHRQGDPQEPRSLLRERAQREASGRRDARPAGPGEPRPSTRRGPADPRRRAPRRPSTAARAGGSRRARTRRRGRRRRRGGRT